MEVSGSAQHLATGTRLRWANAPRSQRRQIARGLLRDELEGTFGAIHFRQRCPACGQVDHGPLHVEAVNPDPKSPRRRIPLVSISYAGDLALVAVAPISATSFGIDAEVDSSQNRAAAIEALGSESIRDPVAEWTRLEAIAKAKHTGLRGNWQTPDVTGFECYAVNLPIPWASTLLSFAIRF